MVEQWNNGNWIGNSYELHVKTRSGLRVENTSG